MKLLTRFTASALALALVSAPAFAAGVSVGATVFGPGGDEVGTIDSVDGGNVVLNTGALTATLPADVFGESEKGPTIGWTKDQLEEAIKAADEEAKQAFAAALVEGAELYSVDGVLLGTIKSIAEEDVVADLANGPVSLKKAQMALQGDKLTFLATAADVEAATGG